MQFSSKLYNQNLGLNIYTLNYQKHPFTCKQLLHEWFSVIVMYVINHRQSYKGGKIMTDRLQEYYDYLETKNHNRNMEAEQAKHNREVERLTKEAQDEQAKHNRNTESLQSESNAINRYANELNYAVGMRNAATNEVNAGVNQQNANTNARNADTNKMNAETQSRKEAHDYFVNSANANTNAKKQANDAIMRSKEYMLASEKTKRELDNASRSLDQAQAKLDLAMREYELNKTDKYWNNVLKSISTFNSTADTWARLTGVAAPTTTRRINVADPKNNKTFGTVTFRDVAKISRNLIRG